MNKPHDKPRPSIKLHPVESSQVAAVGYDAATRTLAVSFKRGAGSGLQRSAHDDDGEEPREQDGGAGSGQHVEVIDRSLRLASLVDDHLVEAGDRDLEREHLFCDLVQGLVDIPVQRDQDDEFGYYVAAYGTGTGWSGGVLQLSIDDGATVYSETDVLPASVVGVTATDLLADISGEYFDDQVLRVEVDGTLESVSRGALLNYKNLLAVQRADGSWEVLQYQTATQVSDGVYDLSGLVRGRFATGATAIASGGTAVKIDTSLLFVRLQQFMLGMTLKYRAVSYGQDPDAVAWLAHSATAPQSQTEWAPVGVEAVRDGGDVTVTWIERPRLGVETAPRQSKYFAGYRVKYSDGATFDVAGTTHTRTGAPASQTITVCGLNTITGEGRQSEAVTV